MPAILRCNFVDVPSVLTNHQDTKDTKVTKPIPPEVNAVARVIVDAALRVHTELGPGLLESVYEDCLAEELRSRGHVVEQQVLFPVQYRGRELEARLRLDLLVEFLVVVELKAVERLAPVHDAQMLTYLRLTGCRVGLILNFNVARLRDGIKRLAL